MTVKLSKQIHVYLPPVLYEEFIHFTRESEFPQCEIVRNALRQYLAENQHLLPKLANNNETTGEAK